MSEGLLEGADPEKVARALVEATKAHDLDPPLPPLPKLDPAKDSLRYESIRAVPGYPAPVIHRYATNYALLAIAMERERCAKICDQLGADRAATYIRGEESE